LSVVLAGCASAPASLPALPRPAVRVDGVHVGALDTESMRRGAKIGRYEWSLLCGAPYESVFWLGRGTLAGGTNLTSRARDALRAEGVATLDADERSSARIRLTGRVKSIDMTLCRVSALVAEAPKSVSGRGRVEIEWTAARVSGDTPPLVTTTSGEATLNDGVPDGASVILEWAIVEATRALARSDDFIATAKGAAPAKPPGTERIDGAPRTPGVGGEIAADVDGRTIKGTVAGRSRRPDTGKPVILLDLDGRAVPKGALIRDSSGRVVARSLGAGARWNQAAWIGLVAAEVAGDGEGDVIDPAPPGPTYQPEPDDNDPNGPDR